MIYEELILEISHNKFLPTEKWQTGEKKIILVKNDLKLYAHLFNLIVFTILSGTSDKLKPPDK